MKKLTIITMLFAAVTALQAQDTLQKKVKADVSESKQRIFGIGFRTSPLNLDELILNNEFIPSNRVIVTINAHPHFRIQPEMGYYREKEYSNLLKEDIITAKSLAIGAGMYYQWQKDKTNLYAGPKVMSVKNVFTYLASSYNPNPPYNPIYDKETNTISYMNTGLALGGEYLFGNHFSAGAEVGVMNSKANVSYSEDPSDNYESSRIMTEASLLFRFYF